MNQGPSKPGRLRHLSGMRGVAAAALVAVVVTAWLLRGWLLPGLIPEPTPPTNPAPEGAVAPPGTLGRVRVLNAPPAYVIDGDTFAADLNGDGRIEQPREHVRLLYVDTPELSESWKGKDRVHGEPARDFLVRALARPPLRLRLPPPGEDRDRYGRTLAVVEAAAMAEPGNDTGNVDLALIRAGYSPFDTRFSFPGDYDRYAAVEGEAFDARRGIWADADSRNRYLKRLRRELRTPAGVTNPLFVPGILHAGTLDAEALMGRYVRVEGRLAGRKRLSKGVYVLLLERPTGRTPFPAVVFARLVARLGVTKWQTGRSLRLEGFLHRYRGRPELVVHYGVER